MLPVLVRTKKTVLDAKLEQNQLLVPASASLTLRLTQTMSVFVQQITPETHVRPTWAFVSTDGALPALVRTKEIALNAKSEPNQLVVLASVLRTLRVTSRMSVLVQQITPEIYVRPTSVSASVDCAAPALVQTPEIVQNV